MEGTNQNQKIAPRQMQLQIDLPSLEDSIDDVVQVETQGPFHQAISPIPLIVHDIDSSDFSSDDDYEPGAGDSQMMENMGTTPSQNYEDRGEASDSSQTN